MYLFPFILILVVLFNLKLKQSSRKANANGDDFWERERKANSVRRKSIDNLDYITIPLEDLPFFENPERQIAQYQDKIRSLSEKKILNLSGYSNTDLKLEYGSANLTLLSNYDDNYNNLITTLNKLGQRLIQLDHTPEGVRVLEYAISIGSDISGTYTSLAGHYSSIGDTDALNRLIDRAGSLDSIMKESILAKLTEVAHKC